MTQDEQARLIAILDYWHKVEFFIPFDLDQKAENDNLWNLGKLRWLTASELPAMPAASLWQGNVPDDCTITHFYLFLGIFDKADIAHCAKQINSRPDRPEDTFEDTERSDLEGRTCFARIRISRTGEPIFEPFSVSTVPWALGQTRSKGLSALRYDAFEAAKEQLKDLLQNFRASRSAPQAVEGDDPVPVPLSGVEILALYQLFVDWAGYTPSTDPNHHVALLEIVTKQKKPPQGGTAPGTERRDRQKSTKRAHASGTTDQNEQETETEASETGDEETEIDILNTRSSSFFRLTAQICYA